MTTFWLRLGGQWNRANNKEILHLEGEKVGPSDFSEAQAFTPVVGRPPPTFSFLSAPFRGRNDAIGRRPNGTRFSRIVLSLHLVHLARIALIGRDCRPELLKIVNEEAKCGGWPIRHNAMPDHVHLLIRLPPTVKVSEFIGQVKGASTHRFNEEIRPSFKLKWQEGYGVLTLRPKTSWKRCRYTSTTKRPTIAWEDCRSCWSEPTATKINPMPRSRPPEGG